MFISASVAFYSCKFVPPACRQRQVRGKNAEGCSRKIKKLFMKYLKCTVFALLAFVISGNAQQAATAKTVIKTPGLYCDICKDKVEQALFKQYGIISYKVDIKHLTTTVSWITDRTDIEQIKTMIANAGFDADDVTADEVAYKRLPPCCKNPVGDTMPSHP